jgi:D-alanyl-D-alanine carboxypeptidase
MAKYVRLGLPGMSVLVQDSSGQLIAAAGLADVGENVPFEPCTPSKAASITKLMVGTLAHRLHTQGLLNLDTTIDAYIESKIIKKIKNAEGKTLRQLMHHTTGIYDVITGSDFYLAVLNQPNKRWKPEELLEFVYGKDGVALGHPYPASYSNTNTLLLMMCIEKATGRPHTDLLHEQIWGPLGMTSTYMQGREDLPATAAHGYFDLYNNGTVADVSQLITGSGNGYGGMFSTTQDLLAFMDALWVKQTLVAPAELTRMQTVLQEDTNFFCGESTVLKRFGKKRTPGIGHTGRDLGYVANCFYYPSRKTFIIFFVNYGTNGSSRLKQTFFDFEEELAALVLD